VQIGVAKNGAPRARAAGTGAALLSPIAVDTAAKEETQMNRIQNQQGRVGYALMWLLGVPLPVLLVLYLIFR
jgi:hypothetical protein